MEFYQINNEEEMKWLANEMKMDAVKDKQTEPGEYSKTKEEALERAKYFYEKNENITLSNVILYKEKIYSLVLTCDTWEETEKWHLSLGKQDMVNPVPERADDEACNFIVSAFFENFEEGPSEGAFTSIRHFRAVKK